MKNQNWKTMFKIDRVIETTEYGFPRFVTYKLLEKVSGISIGIYKDYKYAIKQAKHKYNKRIKKIEKILLKS